MSLNFYADSELTLPMTGLTPKRFLFPNAGGSQTSQLYLGDPYSSNCTSLALPGATTIFLSDTSGFLTAAQIATTSGHVGTAISENQTFTYTGKTQSSLTGVSGITENIPIDAVVAPSFIYYGIGGTNIEMFPSGTDLLNYGIQISMGSTSVLGFPGMPAIFQEASVATGVSNALEVFIQVTIPAGADQVFTNFGIQVSSLYLRDARDTTPYSVGESTYGPFSAMYAYQHDEWLPIPLRVLPVNRQVPSNLPGFIVGQYRWRDESTSNATALVPTNWNIDPASLNAQWVAGIGDQNDLAPVQLQQDGNSVRMDVHSGDYFTGINKYYLPANPVLEFHGVSQAAANSDNQVVLQLSNTPLPTTPIFVGMYSEDSQGFYETEIQYRYEATLTNPDGSARTDLPEYYFTMNRATNQITLNVPQPTQIIYLGTVSGQPNDYFDLSLYPVDNIETIYVNEGANVPFLYTNTWTFNQEAGTVVVPSIPGALTGEPVFATCSPSVAVLYDVGNSTSTQEITSVDFNPAFSGITSGYFYLQQNRQKPTSLVLSCDKPIIPIPATQTTIIGLVAYGPVYFANDYALLTVTAYGANNQPIPNATLDVIINPYEFTGSINYENPLTQTVTVVTGGDGEANLIFIAEPGYGLYVPTTPASIPLAGLATTHIANDTIVLPVNVPISEIWTVSQGWQVTTYYVLNNDPLYGMVGAVPSLGELPFTTVGTPGEINYRTNGQLTAWTVGFTPGGPLVLPIDALDVHGNSYTSSLFNGTVCQLVYSTAVPQNPTFPIGSYFIVYTQWITIQMQLQNSDLLSNEILLQIQPPLLINDNPWLIVNDQIQGILNQFRLGFVPGTTVV